VVDDDDDAGVVVDVVDVVDEVDDVLLVDDDEVGVVDEVDDVLLVDDEVDEVVSELDVVGSEVLVVDDEVGVVVVGLEVVFEVSVVEIELVVNREVETVDGLATVSVVDGSEVSGSCTVLSATTSLCCVRPLSRTNQPTIPITRASPPKTIGVNHRRSIMSRTTSRRLMLDRAPMG
jgi:hypothetical protein